MNEPGYEPVDGLEAMAKQAMKAADAIVCNVASSGIYMVKLLDELGLGRISKDCAMLLA